MSRRFRIARYVFLGVGTLSFFVTSAFENMSTMVGLCDSYIRLSALWAALHAKI